MVHLSLLTITRRACPTWAVCDPGAADRGVPPCRLPLAFRTDFDAAELKQCACRSSETNQARRPLALTAIYDGASRAKAAEIGGVTRQILRD